MQTFSGEGNTPSPDPTPGAYGASIFAPTALKLNVTPPKKILVTALLNATGLSICSSVCLSVCLSVAKMRTLKNVIFSKNL